MEEITLCLADAHGNLPALEAALAAGKSWGATRILALGDMVGELPDSRAVMLRLLEENAVFIRGNRERDMADFPESWRGMAQFACLEAAHGDLGELTLPMRDWPIARRLPGLTLSHGSPEDVYEILQRGMPRMQGLLARNPEPLMLVGHDHLQWSYARGGKTAAGVGSVGLAHDLSHAVARFALLAGGRLHFMAVPYDPALLMKKAPAWIERCGPLARAAVEEAVTGNYAILDLVHHAQRVAQRELGQVPSILPNAVFHLAAGEFFAQSASRLMFA